MPNLNESPPSKIINDRSIIFGLSSDDFLLFGLSLFFMEAIGILPGLVVVGVLVLEVLLLIVLRKNFRRKIIRNYLQHCFSGRRVRVSKIK